MYRKSVLLMVAVLLLVMAISAANASLVARYEFSGNANDSSGNGHNGTLMNGATTVTDAQRGQVLSLNGNSQYVDCGTGPTIVGTGSFTVTAWLKTTYTSDCAIVTQRDPGSNSGSYGFSLVQNGKTQIYDYDGGYGFLFQSNGTVTNGQWHHVAAVRTNSTDGKLYIDGNLVGQGSGAAISLRQVLVVIGRGYTGPYYYHGLMDDVRIYDNALSQSDIRAMVPEPASLIILGLGAILLERRSRV